MKDKPHTPSRAERRVDAQKRKLTWRELPHLAARGNGQKKMAAGQICCVVVLPP